MDDPNFDIGARLFAMRKAAQLSQRQLAERAGVPHAQISIIEQNKSSPSIATLRKILSGLNLSMGDFFEGERAAPEGPFFHPEDLLDLTSKLPASGVTDQQGRMAFRQIGDARRHNLQILHEVYEKGADTGENMLDHFSTEGGYVIEGALERHLLITLMPRVSLEIEHVHAFDKEWTFEKFRVGCYDAKDDGFSGHIATIRPKH